MPGSLVCSNCCNKRPQSGELINNRIIFHHSAGWEFQDQGARMAQFLVHGWHRCEISSHGGRGQGVCGVSFLGALMKASPSKSKHLPISLPLIPSSLGVRISTYEFWGGGTNIQTTALSLDNYLIHMYYFCNSYYYFAEIVCVFISKCVFSTFGR